MAPGYQPASYPDSKGKKRSWGVPASKIPPGSLDWCSLLPLLSSLEYVKGKKSEGRRVAGRERRELSFFFFVCVHCTVWGDQDWQIESEGRKKTEGFKIGLPFLPTHSLHSPSLPFLLFFTSWKEGKSFILDAEHTNQNKKIVKKNIFFSNDISSVLFHTWHFHPYIHIPPSQHTFCSPSIFKLSSATCLSYPPLVFFPFFWNPWSRLLKGASFSPATFFFWGGGGGGAKKEGESDDPYLSTRTTLKLNYF